MIEIPEAVVLSKQIEEAFLGAEVVSVLANASPHKFAWYNGDPARYKEKLVGCVVSGAVPIGGQVEIQFDHVRLTLSDGVNIRVYDAKEKLPAKHQLSLTFDNGKILIFSVQMYGGLMAFEEGDNQNPYYLVATMKPSPLLEAFDLEYFNKLIEAEKPGLSLKAFLATEQRIPGLGNGVLQDILFGANLHPKKKLGSLTADEVVGLYNSIKETIHEMVRLGGRDTEKDIYGKTCGYLTKLCSKSHSEPCFKCGDIIHKESFMGGSIYFCGTCQKL